MVHTESSSSSVFVKSIKSHQILLPYISNQFPTLCSYYNHLHSGSITSHLDNYNNLITGLSVKSLHWLKKQSDFENSPWVVPPLDLGLLQLLLSILFPTMLNSLQFSESLCSVLPNCLYLSCAVLMI